MISLSLLFPSSLSLFLPHTHTHLQLFHLFELARTPTHTHTQSLSLIQTGRVFNSFLFLWVTHTIILTFSLFLMPWSVLSFISLSFYLFLLISSVSFIYVLLFSVFCLLFKPVTRNSSAETKTNNSTQTRKFQRTTKTSSLLSGLKVRTSQRSLP